MGTDGSQNKQRNLRQEPSRPFDHQMKLRAHLTIATLDTSFEQTNWTTFYKVLLCVRPASRAGHSPPIPGDRWRLGEVCTLVPLICGAHRQFARTRRHIEMSHRRVAL